MLREAEVHLSQGKSVRQVSREMGITEQTYYHWRKEYGGMKISQARRLKELELRDELLDRETVCTLREAQVLIERWRMEYNTFTGPTAH